MGGEERMTSVNFSMKKEHQQQLKELKIKELRTGSDKVTSSAVIRKYVNHALKRIENGDILITKSKYPSTKRKLHHISMPHDMYLKMCKVRADKIAKGINMSEQEVIERLFEMGYKHRQEII